MTIEEAIKEIEDSGKMLGTGDYVDLDALKVAVEVMKDYQKLLHEIDYIKTANERLFHENKAAYLERDRLIQLIANNVECSIPTMNITITKEQADKLGFKFK